MDGEKIVAEIQRLRPQLERAEDELARMGTVMGGAAYRRAGLIEGQIRAYEAMLIE